jgi:beta-glucosidase
MCSYNQINNSYGCQNSYSLNYLLKNELDFQGFVMSDWEAQHSGVGNILAGLDMVSHSLVPIQSMLTSVSLCQETQPS